MLHNLGFPAPTGLRQRGPALVVLAAAALLLTFMAHYGPPAPAHAQEGECAFPGDPRNVQVTPGHGKLTLTWDEPSSWGSWDGEGRRYYNIQWRRSGFTKWNTIGSNWSNQYPLTAYSFTGTYREQPNSGPSRDHTVVNGTTYELQIRAGASISHECGRMQGYYVQASGTPMETQGTLSADATLSGLELANATLGSTAPAALGVEFDSAWGNYHALVLKEVTTVTVKPTATAGNAATIQVKLGTSGTPQNVASGSVSATIEITPKSDLSEPHEIYVTVIAENGRDHKAYKIRVYQFEPISFGSTTVEDKAYTAGLELSVGPGDSFDQNFPSLPTVTSHDDLDVSYAATGLPAGLSLGQDRVIRGTPETATTGPVTVTYKATADALGSSASLTFNVTVNPPVAFAEDDLSTFHSRIITYTAGQANPLTVTLPEATGGTGTLTYELLFNRETETVTADVPGAGVNLDASTRVLTIDGASNANRIPLKEVGYAITFQAKDENGATASAVTQISVVGPPTLPEIADKTYTIGGDAVDLTLPAGSGPWWNMIPELRYHLGPVVTYPVVKGVEQVQVGTGERLDVEGLAFDPGSRKLTGTATAPGSTVMTYTVTDGNGVSATETFTLNIVNGPSAPSSAPTSLQAAQAGRSAAATWDAVAGATGYVVQVIEASGSYPVKPTVNSAPDGVVLSFDNCCPTSVVFSAISDGDYKVRVAARNEDGVGPWSAEASLTVKIGGL